MSQLSPWNQDRIVDRTGWFAKIPGPPKMPPPELPQVDAHPVESATIAMPSTSDASAVILFVFIVVGLAKRVLKFGDKSPGPTAERWSSQSEDSHMIR